MSLACPVLGAAQESLQGSRMLTGTYALYLPILPGMSGGGVYTNDTRLFATNDFSVTSPGCSTGDCYNGGSFADAYASKQAPQRPPS